MKSSHPKASRSFHELHSNRICACSFQLVSRWEFSTREVRENISSLCISRRKLFVVCACSSEFVLTIQCDRYSLWVKWNLFDSTPPTLLLPADWIFLFCHSANKSIKLPSEQLTSNLTNFKFPNQFSIGLEKRGSSRWAWSKSHISLKSNGVRKVFLWLRRRREWGMWKSIRLAFNLFFPSHLSPCLFPLALSPSTQFQPYTFHTPHSLFSQQYIKKQPANKGWIDGVEINFSMGRRVSSFRSVETRSLSPGLIRYNFSHPL